MRSQIDMPRRVNIALVIEADPTYRRVSHIGNSFKNPAVSSACGRGNVAEESEMVLDAPCESLSPVRNGERSVCC